MTSPMLRSLVPDRATILLARVRRDGHVALRRAARIKFALGVPGALALATLILGELIATEIQRLAGTTAHTVAGIIVLAAIIGVLAYRWAGALPGAPSEGTYGASGTAKLTQRRGLVLIAGLDSAHPDSAAAKLLASLPQLEYLAVIGTPQTEELNVVPILVEKIAPACGVRLPAARVRSWSFGAAESISDNEEASAEALRWMLGRGLDPSEIVVDVSAGRRAMTYGAKDAADEVLVETQYLSATWDTATNQPIPGTSMFKVIKTYHP